MTAKRRWALGPIQTSPKNPYPIFTALHTLPSLMASPSLTSLSSVLNQQHCINLPKRCSILTLRFFSLKTFHYSPTYASPIVCRRRAPERNSASAFSHSISRSFSDSPSRPPVSIGSKFSETPGLHHFMPKASTAVTDASVSDPQLE